MCFLTTSHEITVSHKAPHIMTLVISCISDARGILCSNWMIALVKL